MTKPQMVRYLADSITFIDEISMDYFCSMEWKPKKTKCLGSSK